MRPANAPEPECHLDGKPLSPGVVVDVVIQFNRDALSQTDHVRVLRILDGGVRTTKVSGGRACRSIGQRNDAAGSVHSCDALSPQGNPRSSDQITAKIAGVRNKASV